VKALYFNVAKLFCSPLPAAPPPPFCSKVTSARAVGVNVFACDPPPPPKREREGERPFGLRDIQVYRVGQHYRHFGLCLFLRHGSWRKGNTRGRPERPPPRSCRLQTASCFCARTRVRARSFLCGSVLDAERRWPGAVREGWGCADGQSGCGRSVRVRTRRA
jgi:hypothetical protein